MVAGRLPKEYYSRAKRGPIGAVPKTVLEGPAHAVRHRLASPLHFRVNLRQNRSTSQSQPTFDSSSKVHAGNDSLRSGRLCDLWGRVCV